MFFLQLRLQHLLLRSDCRKLLLQPINNVLLLMLQLILERDFFLPHLF